MRERMRDSEFAANIGMPFRRAIAGYYGGPREAHQWGPAEWKRFPRNRKLPIWVGGFDGQAEGHEAVKALRALGVPRGTYTALDMETRVDRTYVEHFGEVVRAAGYKVFVYGSAATVFRNPHLNGYWVADYAGRGPFMYNHKHVRMTQYADPNSGSGGDWDSSTVKLWTYHFGRWWR